MSKTINSVIGASLALLLLAGLSLLASPTASASHSWGGYHWARTANPFALKVADNVTSTWDSYLDTTIADWSASSVVDITKVVGTANPKTCRATAGQVGVCNARYGNNGWLGIASIWITGGVHITQGTVKLNDTYYDTAKYNTSGWRNLVMCQEVGHTLGLDHQDENFNNANLGTCMDYTSAPESNQHPNTHDYSMLGSIYAHFDSFTTLSASTASRASRGADVGDDPSTWGKEIRTSNDRGLSVFEKDLGSGNKVITHVYWVDGRHAE